jgi:macrolide-specific efflux system membrane fusion protein
MKKKKHLTLTIAAAIVLIIAAVFLSTRLSKPKTVYTEIRPAIGTIQVEFRQTGTIYPKNRLQITSPVPGRLENVLVSEGDKVIKGQVIAWVSSNERASLLDAARAHGPAEEKKWENIYRPAPVTAPLSGFIIARNNEPGQTIAVSDAFLVMADKLIVNASVYETDLRYIHLGQKVTILLDAFPDKKYAGVVDQIAYESQVVNNVTVYLVKVLPLETPPVFKSGMTATILFTSEPKVNILIIPFDAIRDKSGKQYVMVKVENEKPEERFIETGISNAKNVEILSGLSESDTVLIEKKKGRKANLQQFGGGVPGMGPR